MHVILLVGNLGCRGQLSLPRPNGCSARDAV